MNSQVSHVPPILLTIAGFDPSCGAGVGADLKTFAAHNCYGVAAVTALTVQSTQGVRDVHPTPSATLRAQLDVLLEDVTLAAVKIGMLANRANASVVAEFLDKHKFGHVVLDPVSRPTAGSGELLDAAGLKFVRDELLKRATVITPNMPEAEFLTGMEVKDLAAMKAAAEVRPIARETHGLGDVGKIPDHAPEAPMSGVVRQPAKADVGVEEQVLFPFAVGVGTAQRADDLEQLAAQGAAPAQRNAQSLLFELVLFDDADFGPRDVDPGAARGARGHDGLTQGTQRNRSAAARTIDDFQLWRRHRRQPSRVRRLVNWQASKST